MLPMGNSLLFHFLNVSSPVFFLKGFKVGVDGASCLITSHSLSSRQYKSEEFLPASHISV